MLEHTMAEWLTAEKFHEGFPLLLRRPAALAVVSLRPLFPTLAFVTHALTHVTSNGLPQSEYNAGLSELDHEILNAFDANSLGVAVLVETYAGERCYYFYVAAHADVSHVVSKVGRRYPRERLSSSMRPDPSWQFIEEYARDHF
jgi:hypothetical protein